MSGLMKMLDPLLKPAARFYQAQLAKDLNKMGTFETMIISDETMKIDSMRHGRKRGV